MNLATKLNLQDVTRQKKKSTRKYEMIFDVERKVSEKNLMFWFALMLGKLFHRRRKTYFIMLQNLVF